MNDITPTCKLKLNILNHIKSQTRFSAINRSVMAKRILINIKLSYSGRTHYTDWIN